MTKNDIQTYIISPDSVNQESVQLLNDVIDRYPYASILRMVRLKGLQSIQDVSYEQELKCTAIYAGDRSVLYDLMKPQKQRELAVELIQVEEEPKEIPVEESSSDETRDIELEAEARSGQYILEVSDEIPKLDDLIKKEVQDIPPSPKREEPALIEDEIEAEAAEEEEEESQEITSLVDFVTSKSRPILNKTSKGPAQNKEEKLKDFVKQTKKALKGTKPIFSPEKMAKLSLLEDENLVTETLAKVFAKQKNFKKAIKAYKQLSLKYPEKSIYFAAQIEKIKEQEGKEKRNKGKKKEEEKKPKSKKKKVDKKNKGKKKKKKEIKAKKKSKKKSTKKNKKK